MDGDFELGHKNAMRKTARAITALAIALACASSGHAQPAPPPDYARYAPVYELAKRLEARYAKPVTVENSPLVWRGEMERRGFARNGVEILVPSPYSLLLAPDHPIFRAPALVAGVVEQALDIYHRQNSGRTRYKVTESSMGFHIVPVLAYDETGAARPVKSLLDTPVSIPKENRTATEHVHAILQEVARATGIPIRDPYWNLDGRYAANGYIPRSRNGSDADRPYAEFQWGASEMLAREALVDLLSGSATTMTWTLTCGPDATANNRQACQLDVNPLAVGDKRTDLYLDRCTKCKYVPK